MARLNIEDQFWLDIMSVAARIGDQDVAIGNAVRFIKFAQEKHKQAKLITREEFEANGFRSELIPLFAEVTPEGLIKARGADKFFDWLRKKKEAGKKGGKISGKRRSSKKKQDKANEAETSESQQAEPSISISTSISNSSKKEPPLPRLAVVWNAFAHEALPRVRSMDSGSNRRKACLARWKAKPDLDYWKSVIAKLNTLPGARGKNDKNWFADIEFLTRPDTAEKLLEGKYDGIWGTGSSGSSKGIAEIRAERQRQL